MSLAKRLLEATADRRFNKGDKLKIIKTPAGGLPIGSTGTIPEGSPVTFEKYDHHRGYATVVLSDGERISVDVRALSK